MSSNSPSKVIEISTKLLKEFSTVWGLNVASVAGLWGIHWMKLYKILFCKYVHLEGRCLLLWFLEGLSTTLEFSCGAERMSWHFWAHSVLDRGTATTLHGLFSLWRFYFQNYKTYLNLIMGTQGKCWSFLSWVKYHFSQITSGLSRLSWGYIEKLGRVFTE